MSKLKESQGQLHGVTSGNEMHNSNASEATIKNISIPGSEFSAKWVKDKGYAIGYEGVKLTKDYGTLEEALNQIGYGVGGDNDVDELVKVELPVNYEMVIRIVRAVLIVMGENQKTENNEKDN